MEWHKVKKTVSSAKYLGFTTKLIMFAPKDVAPSQIDMINKLEHIHDKYKPIRSILKGEPLCTVLFKSKDFTESYRGAMKIINKITAIIG
jgi:predicted ATP-grasp superfamily ATP-dependent carboligase